MLSPNPLSLLCALLLCLPLVIFFTTIKHTTIVIPNPIILNIPNSLSKNISIPQNSKHKQPLPIENYNHVPFHKKVLPSIITLSDTNRYIRMKARSIRPSTVLLSPPSSSLQIQNHVDTNTKTKSNKILLSVSSLSLLPLSSFQNQSDILLTARSIKPNKKSKTKNQGDMLFKVASRVKAKPIRPNKIAFMFITTTPLPFAPLWESYFNKTPTSKNLYNIYIHADPTFSYNPPFSGVFYNRVIPSKPTKRFSPTLTAAARRLLGHALLHDPSNSMFVLLSPSCIPLHSVNFTYHALHRRHGKSFIEILANETTARDRWAARGSHAMLPEVKFEAFRVGSQFWALTRQHARLVISDRVLWPKFDVPCMRWDTCYPEENYFPTLLSMWDPQGCVHATLTHVNWTGRVDGHPRTYEAWEVGPELIRRIRKDRPRYGDGDGDGYGDGPRDPFLFARKFAADALQPLMRIANDVIFTD